MKKDGEIEVKLCDIKDKLDTLLMEKGKIDKINANIDLRLGKFNEKYKNNKKVQEDVLKSDDNIEEKYSLLKQELGQVGSERENIIKRNAILEKKKETITQQ